MTSVADRLVKEKTDQPPYDTRHGTRQRFKYRRRFAEFFITTQKKTMKIIQCADVLPTVAMDSSTIFLAPPLTAYLL